LFLPFAWSIACNDTNETSGARQIKSPATEGCFASAGDTSDFSSFTRERQRPAGENDHERKRTVYTGATTAK
jgi:hypothetical protein